LGRVSSSKNEDDDTHPKKREITIKF